MKTSRPIASPIVLLAGASIGLAEPYPDKPSVTVYLEVSVPGGGLTPICMRAQVVADAMFAAAGQGHPTASRQRFYSATPLRKKGKSENNDQETLVKVNCVPRATGPGRSGSHQSDHT